MRPTEPAAGRLGRLRIGAVGLPTWAVDGLLALALLAAEVFIVIGAPALTPSTFAVLAVGYLPLTWRRRAPRLVLLLTLVHTAVAVVGVRDAIPTLSVLCALYTVASLQALRPSLEALTLATLVMVPAQVDRERLDAGGSMSTTVSIEVGLIVASVLALAWGNGRWANSSRSKLVSLDERRRLAAVEAVAAERRRMARELHDVVSHAVSIMVLQAAGARRVLATEPARAEEALGRIESLGKQSMAELRRLLGVLRDGDFVEPGGAGEGTAQPGMAQVDGLVDTFRASGLAVRSEVVGHPRPLDSSVDLSAFRVVQESLTNAVKHGGSDVSVVVRQVWTGEALLLEVTDDGHAAPAPVTDDELSTGNGLVGLRERARALGGRLDAGPRADGHGYRVSVALPIRPAGRSGEREGTEAIR